MTFGIGRDLNQYDILGPPSLEQAIPILLPGLLNPKFGVKAGDELMITIGYYFSNYPAVIRADVAQLPGFFFTNYESVY